MLPYVICSLLKYLSSLNSWNRCIGAINVENKFPWCDGNICTHVSATWAILCHVTRQCIKIPPKLCVGLPALSRPTTANPESFLCLFIVDIGECSGSIVDFDQSFGLTLSTPLNPNYLIPLSELSEPGEDVNMAAFTVGQTIKCRIAVKKRRSGVIVLTLREKG